MCETLHTVTDLNDFIEVYSGEWCQFTDQVLTAYTGLSLQGNQTITSSMKMIETLTDYAWSLSVPPCLHLCNYIQ